MCHAPSAVCLPCLHKAMYVQARRLVTEALARSAAAEALSVQVRRLLRLQTNPAGVESRAHCVVHQRHCVCDGQGGRWCSSSNLHKGSVLSQSNLCPEILARSVIDTPLCLCCEKPCEDKLSDRRALTQAGLAINGSPLAGITNRHDSRPPTAGEGKSAQKAVGAGSGCVGTQTETCSGAAALSAASCGANRLVRLATLGRQSALACVTTCLAAVQGMPWMM